MLIKRPNDITPSEITPREVFERRRDFIKAAGALALAAGMPSLAWAREAFPGLQKSPYSTLETPLAPAEPSCDGSSITWRKAPVESSASVGSRRSGPKAPRNGVCIHFLHGASSHCF